MDTVGGNFILFQISLFSGSTVMITTGFPTSSATTRTTEVVNVVSGETCPDLVDFPLPITGAVGANLDGTPVVCGGAYLQKCYKLTISGWQEFASMNEKRGYAAGIMYKNKFHVFGGHDGSSSSEIISIDGAVEYGPQLPTSVWQHAITSINSTVSILIGGYTSATVESPLTWYFNHESNIFSTGPSLLVGRRDHDSATCVDKVTKTKIPIVTGGRGNGDHELDSTELLINDQWQSGTIQCKKSFDLL